MDNKNENEMNFNEDSFQEETENLTANTENTPENKGESEGYVAQFGDVEGLSEDYTVTVTEPEKKKFFLFRYINPSIFVAICVFLIAILAFGAYYIFGAKTITGSWVYVIENESQSTDASADEVENSKTEQFYVFESADATGKGKLYTYCEGAEQCSEYTLTSDGDKKVLKLGSTELYYEVEGIKLFGNAKLKLTQPAQEDETTGQETEEQTITLSQSDRPDYESQTIADYTTDEKLTGEWEADRSFLYYGMYEINYTEKVTVKDNGIIVINYVNDEMGIDSTMYYSYSAKSGNLTIQRATSKDKDTVKYTVKDGKLTFVDKTNNSMFYDEVFGDATYYEKGKKPKETTQPATEETESTKADKTETTTKAK